MQKGSTSKVVPVQ